MTTPATAQSISPGDLRRQLLQEPHEDANEGRPISRQQRRRQERIERKHADRPGPRPITASKPATVTRANIARDNRASTECQT